MVGQALKLTLAGVVIGAVAALLAMRLLHSLLFGVKPSDPATLVIVAALLTGAALLANYVPALRATKIDPMIALRQE